MADANSAVPDGVDPTGCARVESEARIEDGEHRTLLADADAIRQRAGRWRDRMLETPHG